MIDLASSPTFIMFAFNATTFMLFILDKFNTCFLYSWFCLKIKQYTWVTRNIVSNKYGEIMELLQKSRRHFKQRKDVNWK